ncbi:hypothetical protein AYO21_04304 [Fonsecaea monophora]|uniref:VOC domain-containing protein n=1 Tax=Fonsecaea monophora TaxID=254056 RepID=A0A177FD26_9EURO|nr:hypothetical protein AYO21_04304 [Fonsecaea monophora]KAH0848274.1 glyoxalase/bleomycin resistance protein/dioxygenase [Fonsecaea pedrosoi]OAG41362.1 hypothetical protein AYO21_04304 [Fonsecaea monophora]
MASIQHNRPFNHVGVSVPDIQKAVDWYSSLFGFQLIGNKIHDIKRAEVPNAPIFGIYPESLQHVKVAYMATGNGVGFELFEFGNPKTYVPEKEFEYHRGGFFHICVTDPEPDALVGRIVKAGGKQIGATVDPVFPVPKNIKCLYAADPWGNVIEILDISFERLTTLANPSSK